MAVYLQNCGGISRGIPRNLWWYKAVYLESSFQDFRRYFETLPLLFSILFLRRYCFPCFFFAVLVFHLDFETSGAISRASAQLTQRPFFEPFFSCVRSGPVLHFQYQIGNAYDMIHLSDWKLSLEISIHKIGPARLKKIYNKFCANIIYLRS